MHIINHGQKGASWMSMPCSRWLKVSICPYDKSHSSLKYHALLKFTITVGWFYAWWQRLHSNKSLSCGYSSAFVLSLIRLSPHYTHISTHRSLLWVHRLKHCFVIPYEIIKTPSRFRFHLFSLWKPIVSQIMLKPESSSKCKLRLPRNWIHLVRYGRIEICWALDSILP